MRGKRRKRRRPSYFDRLIPAHAGKTPFPAQNTSPWRAHPRACGENRSDPRRAADRRGSSPRMRGKLPRIDPSEFQRGLIPAHAGKTLDRTLETQDREAHPRACGENVILIRQISKTLGSSPRMRGKPRQTSRRPRRHRLIPAHAGKTGGNQGGA